VDGEKVRLLPIRSKTLVSKRTTMRGEIEDKNHLLPILVQVLAEKFLDSVPGFVTADTEIGQVVDLL